MTLINEDFRQYAISTLNRAELEADDFSQICYKMLEENHWIYSKDIGWYHYLPDKNHWKPANKHAVQNLLGNFINEYCNVSHEYLEKTYYGKPDYDSMRRRYLANNRTIMNGAFQSEIYDELLELFQRDLNATLFSKKLDRNYTKIAFKNGVLNEQNNELVPGQPEDLISLSTDYNFEKPNQKLLDTLIHFLENVFQKPNDYLELIANLKRGIWGKVSEPVYIIGGSFCGVRLLQNIISGAFGDYLFNLSNYRPEEMNQIPPGTRVIIVNNLKNNKDLEMLKRQRSQVIVISTVDINPAKKSLYCTREITRIWECAKKDKEIIFIDPILDECSSTELGNAFLWFITH